MEGSNARCLCKRSESGRSCFGEALETGVGPHGQSRRSHCGRIEVLRDTKSRKEAFPSQTGLGILSAGGSVSQ